MSSSWTLPLKILLISVGVVTIAVTAKSSFCNFALNDLPVILSVVASWLQPPYVYLILNIIIITIIISTHFLPNHNQFHQHADYFQSNTPPPLQMTFQTLAVGGSVDGGGDENEHDFNATWNMSVVGSPPPPNKAPSVVTSRFDYNPKPEKNVQEGPVALRVLKPKKHETLDSTWKMITKSSRKSDTFVNLHRSPPSDALTKVARKSETFKDRTVFGNQNHQAATGKPKKELTPSHEELNRRIDAFIKKINDNMRLQRQESLNFRDDFHYDKSSPKKKVTNKSRTFNDNMKFEDKNNKLQSPKMEEKLSKELTPSHEELNRRVETFIKKFNDDLRMQRQESLNQLTGMVDHGTS